MGDLIRDATGNDLTYRIVGAAMVVQNALGYGYKEEVYERALAVEPTRCGIDCVRQHPVEVGYEGQTVARFFLDLLVGGTMVVEVKAFGHRLARNAREPRHTTSEKYEHIGAQTRREDHGEAN